MVLAGADHAPDELGVGAHDPGDARPQRPHHRAGQGGDVHDVGRPLLAGAGEAVRSGPAGPRRRCCPPSIDLPFFAMKMSPGRCALASGRFSAQQRMPITLSVGPDLAERAHGEQHGGGARHVALHLPHLVAGLEADAAGVEGDALADEGDRLLRGLLRDVAQDHHAAGVGAARADVEDAAGSPGPRARRVEHLDLELDLAGDLAGRRRDDSGVTTLPGSLIRSRARFTFSDHPERSGRCAPRRRPRGRGGRGS